LLTAARDVELVPSGQRLQLWLPAETLNVPWGHAVHGPPSGPVKPASHLQSAWLVLPLLAVCEFSEHVVHTELRASANVPAAQVTHVVLLVALRVGEAVPAGQRLQFPAPTEALNVPASQLRHTAPSVPVNPASHWQSSTLPLPAGDTAWRPHGVHRSWPSYA
tara:strand:- start:3316 stop:3804 length:489 start_codon:yes stop_codon:yes gene_type:complete